MSEKRRTYRRGLTLIEVLITLVIMVILALISVPRHDLLVHRARAVEPSSELISIYNSSMAYYSDWGAMPTSLSVLEEQGYVSIDETTRRSWDFYIEGDAESIVAVNVNGDDNVPDGEIVRYDTALLSFTGYGYTEQRRN